jgi:hypothetical protein
MKATIEFDLTEEQELFNDACNGHKYKYVLDKLDQEMRSILKYGEKTQEVYDEIQKLRDILYELMHDQNIGL